MNIVDVDLKGHMGCTFDPCLESGRRGSMFRKIQVEFGPEEGVVEDDVIPVSANCA